MDRGQSESEKRRGGRTRCEKKEVRENRDLRAARVFEKFEKRRSKGKELSSVRDRENSAS